MMASSISVVANIYFFIINRDFELMTVINER
jgi:hypothetical protein